ncbi:TlpA family protein disulfide reductase [Mesonia aestuariivivens]|uniref:TlpA family protein disulfide reductase n=1 Tax=Mesonia aestuariivivens TaxID=2796128 RepID=A0ABS6W1G6_9FLAO|nr:TlpA disulfide reductase family protein [Mesonia aestuariivivens]MBW2961703.1 TlpA family protein disulfide reductase [Mesonia aestuariivivens]
MKFIRKYWSNLAIVLIIVILTIPQARREIQVFLNQLLASTPTKVLEEDQKQLSNYHLQLEDIYGRRKNLNESKNRVVFINYWATWCPPCIAEMPDLEELFQKYHEQIDFYFITNDEPDKILKFMQENTYSFPVYFSQTKLPSVLYSNALPTSYVIAKDGKIVFDKAGAANWTSDRFTKDLEQLIAE